MKQGDIFLVDFGINSVGHEYQKRRPTLIVEANEQLAITSLVTVIPITSKIHGKMVDDIILKKDDKNLLVEDSVLKTHYIMSFDKSRFIWQIGEVDKQIIEQTKVSFRKHFGI